MTRRIIGNLFAESLWARLGAASRRDEGRHAPPSLDPRYMPPEDVLERLGALATLLRVFAAEDDILWTPRPIPPERLPDVPGVARPVMLSGARPTPVEGDLCWGDVNPAAASANDRRLAFELQRTLGCALPATHVIEDEDDIDEAVRTAAAASPTGAWIAKAVHTAAGRGRVGSKGAPVSDAHRRGIERLLELHGAVIVEPWMTRLADFGVSAVVGADGVPVHPAAHVLENTQRGDFRGIVLPERGLRGAEASALRAAASAVARAIAACGYRGPFGIDAFRWRSLDGAEHFQPLCEINARFTFGRVALEFADRIAATTGLSAAGPWKFRVGTAADLRAAQAVAPAARFFPLLLPGPPDGVAAWIEC